MAMYQEYLGAALKRAEYEPLEDGGFYAHIPEFEGLWATGPSVEEARQELVEALDEWLRVNRAVSKLPLPDVGVPLVVRKVPE